MGLMDGNGLSVADALALQDNNGNKSDGMLGGGGMWVFFLFFLLAWGGNGIGGLGGNNSPAVQNALTRSDLMEGFNFNQVENNQRALERGLCDGFSSVNTNVLQSAGGITTNMLQGFNGVDKSLCCGFNSVNGAISNLGFQMQNCCCETNRNIDSIRYENAKNTCDIIQAGNMNTQRIIDTMTQNTIQELRDQLQSAQLTLSNASQTQNIVSELRPCAKPAYITCSPYTAMGNGCCGC